MRTQRCEQAMLDSPSVQGFVQSTIPIRFPLDAGLRKVIERMNESIWELIQIISFFNFLRE